MLVRPTQPVEILGNVSMPFGSSDVHGKFCGDFPMGILPSGGLNARGVAKYSDLGPIVDYLRNGARWDVSLC